MIFFVISTIVSLSIILITYLLILQSIEREHKAQSDSLRLSIAEAKRRLEEMREERNEINPPMWTKASGISVRIRDMSDAHLLNTLYWYYKKDAWNMRWLLYSQKINNSEAWPHLFMEAKRRDLL